MEDTERANRLLHSQRYVDYRAGPGVHLRFVGLDVVACDRNGVVGRTVIRFMPQDEQLAYNVASALNEQREENERNHRYKEYVHFAVMMAWC